METDKILSLSDIKDKMISAFSDHTVAGMPLEEKRQQAIEAFRVSGFPTLKNEEWKYTPLSRFIERDWASPEKLDPADFSAESWSGYFPAKDMECHKLVFVNGQMVYADIKPEDNGVIISSLADAMANQLPLVKKYLGTSLPVSVNGLVALNTALAANGCFVYVPEGVALQKPVSVVYLSGYGSEACLSQTRNLVIVSAGASLDFIETYASNGASDSFLNTAGEIFADRGARINHYRFQLEDTEKARQVNFTQINQKKDSLVNNFTLSSGGLLVRNDLQFRLAEKDCESHLYGLYIGSGNQHIDTHTLVDHASAQCLSNEFYKGIMAGKSTGVFNGKIIVRPDAQKTNAYQSNKNILLSDEAHINTKPQLEIFANDVKCSHGATTGQLDEEALFYLRSRGIGEANAKAILTAAFAHDVLENFRNESLKDFAKHIVTEKLESAINQHI